MEQPKNSSEKNLQKKIKDMVGMMGLAGETAAVSPARSVEELIEIATIKEYNTIVAVGSDKLINKIASLIYGKEVVLGVIPIKTGPIVNKILNLDSNNLELACQTLKQRYLKVVDMAYLYPNKYFLTQAQICSNEPIEAELEIDQVKTTVKLTDLIVVSPAINTIRSQYDQVDQSDNRLNIYLTNRKEYPNDAVKFFNWLVGKKNNDNVGSLFRARKFIINTASPIPILIDGKVIDKTPVIFTTKPRALKIITSRDRIQKE